MRDQPRWDIAGYNEADRKNDKDNKEIALQCTKAHRVWIGS